MPRKSSKLVPPERNQYLLAKARLEDLEWILKTDNNVNSAVKRAGFNNPLTAAHYCDRHKRSDLANKIRFYALNLGPYEGKAEDFFYEGKDK